MLKTIPSDVEAEKACLGALIVDNDKILKVIDILREEHFYLEKHRDIFRAIMELYDEKNPVDIITLQNKLKEMGKLENVSISYLSSLLDSIPTTANVEYYARIIYEKYILRSIIRASSEIIEIAMRDNVDINEAIEITERKLLESIDIRGKYDYFKLRDLVIETLKGIQMLAKEKTVYTGVPSGYKAIDDMTSGFQRGDLVVFAGRPAMGKTAFALNLCLNMAKPPYAKKVLFFSLEMSKEQLVQRLLSTESRINLMSLRTGNIKDYEWESILEASIRLSSLDVIIDDTPSASITDIKSKARKIFAKEKGIDVIIIDYLQIIEVPKGLSVIRSRNEEIGFISRSLKALAKELNVPVIVLSQLSRSVEKRIDKRPILSDLRESGSIEQDADLVAFLYREEYYKPDTDKKNIVEIIISKQRNGPVGTIELMFIKEIGKFENLSTADFSYQDNDQQYYDEEFEDEDESEEE
ncbi:MAG: replicative DNA helicase [Spirochaetia bacterium]|nr:replicative DNA helicase [Spirochaetota bacterium]MCX8096187.1 replicative DNA helicase [Spirochaetota bacterium]MDW8111727.1 replicative DNA helicase [Spirochaetia bacterium]